MRLFICACMFMSIACASDIVWDVDERCNNDDCRVVIGKMFGDVAYTHLYCGDIVENTCKKK